MFLERELVFHDDRTTQEVWMVLVIQTSFISDIDRKF